MHFRGVSRCEPDAHGDRSPLPSQQPPQPSTPAPSPQPPPARPVAPYPPHLTPSCRYQCRTQRRLLASRRSCRRRRSRRSLRRSRPRSRRHNRRSVLLWLTLRLSWGVPLGTGGSVSLARSLAATPPSDSISRASALRAGRASRLYPAPLPSHTLRGLRAPAHMYMRSHPALRRPPCTRPYVYAESSSLAAASVHPPTCIYAVLPPCPLDSQPHPLRGDRPAKWRTPVVPPPVPTLPETLRRGRPARRRCPSLPVRPQPPHRWHIYAYMICMHASAGTGAGGLRTSSARAGLAWA